MHRCRLEAPRALQLRTEGPRPAEAQTELAAASPRACRSATRAQCIHYLQAPGLSQTPPAIAARHIRSSRATVRPDLTRSSASAVLSWGSGSARPLALQSGLLVPGQPFLDQRFAVKG